MTPERLSTFAKWATAFDTETHLSQVGLMAPPLVCGSIALLTDETAVAVPRQGHPGISGEILDAASAAEALLTLLEDSNRIIVGAHIAYDMLVCATWFWKKKKRDILPLIFAAYEQGRVYDILIAEALHATALGHLGKDPWTHGDLRNPKTGKTSKYYSLEITTELELGRVDAKANDEWRLKYALLENIPIEDWPPSARTYPIDDVCNTLEVAFAQMGLVPKRSKHRWKMSEDPNSVSAVCTKCSRSSSEEGIGDCWVTERHFNLHQMADQAYTAWVMHLGCAWGFNVDQNAVDKVVKEVEDVREKTSIPLLAAGLLKWKKEKGELKIGHSKSKIARAVAEAHGAHGKCSTCNGLGKVVSPNKKMPVRRAWDAEKDGVNCKDCCATGFDLSTAPSLTLTEPSDMYPKGQIAAGADILYESGDELLRTLADYEEDAKTVTNYGPYLRSCRLLTENGTYIDRPLTLRANVFLETDRVSYGDAIQQFPRDGGLRSCIVARPGYVFASVDYNQGEVITHAQSTLWILGWSKQAEMVLEEKELHSMFGAQVLGVDYDEFFAGKKKIKSYVNARQAAKPWIFGKPGGMGVAKLVLTQRRQGPDTPCENGPVWITIRDDNNKKQKVRGYRGLRFCILMDGATSCGGPGNTSYSWGKEGYERPISPTCTRCLECAARLENEYYRTFPEARAYFKFTGNVVDHGQPLTAEQCEILGLPPGSWTEPGQMVQHVSNILRGDVGFNDCSNGYFQSLLAVAAKKAMRIAQKECCIRTVVPSDACEGGVVSAFAGQVSPLFGGRCIVLQHDEIIAELPEAKACAGAKRLSEIMVRCLQEVCPDMAKVIKAPPALMRRWLKSAEPVWVHAGTNIPCKEDDSDAWLIPWEPDSDSDA